MQGEFFACDSELRALVRESVQNSLDARRPEVTGPVAVRFFLSGEMNALSPKRARRWFRGAFDHFRSEQSGLRNVPDREEPCVFLTIEDSGTSGLNGDPEQYHEIPDSKNPFYYFFRAEGQSNKTESAVDSGETGRGRWGLGKFVFPRSSQVRSFFGLTVRSEDHRRMLVGQCILRSHQVDGTSYTPDGWFGTKPDKKEVAPPIEDENILQEFEEDFALERRREPGLSVVVPYCDRTWTTTDLISCILQDYFWAILNDELALTVEGPDQQFVIQSQSLPEVIRHCHEDVARQLTPLLRLAVWGQKRIADGEFTLLPAVSRKGPPRWNQQELPVSVLESIRREFQADGRAAVRVSIPIQRKGSEPVLSYFDVMIQRQEESPRSRPLFIRNGLVISDVRCRPTRDVCSLVISEDSAICRFLGDAENPAHTEWIEETSHFKGRYLHGSATLRLIRNAAADLCQYLQESSASQDPEVLLDVFSIGTTGQGSPVGFSSRQSHSRLPAQLRNARKPSAGADRPKLCRVTRRNGGFRVIGCRNRTGENQGDLQAATGVVISISVAYDRRGGNPLRNFNSADFRLDESPVMIEFEGARIEVPSPNVLEIRPDRSDFRVMVTGFDPNRDLYLRTAQTKETV